MKPVLSTEEVVRLEDIIEREGTSKAELMELAGEFAANEILKLNPDRVLVLVGFGNNGGGGWVAADILSHKGVDVDIVSPVEPDEIPAALARHVARRTAGRDVHVCVGPSRDELEVLIDKADVVVFHSFRYGVGIGDVEFGHVGEDVVVFGMAGRQTHALAELTVGSGYEYIHRL